MALSYHIPVGETPDKAHEAFYEKQEDGSYILQIDGLPDADIKAQEAPDQMPEQVPDQVPDTVPQEAQNEAPKCHGAGAQKAQPSHTQTIISPHDAQAIQKSLHALATGAVRLG